MRLPMYDVRFSMYDLGSSAATPPMYDVGFSMYDGGRQGLPMYDVRFEEFARRAARGCGADAKRNFGNLRALRGGGSCRHDL